MADAELITYLTRAGLSPKDAGAMLDRWSGSGPGGAGIIPPDFTTGYGPGFGAEGSPVVINGSGFVEFTQGYMLSDNDTHEVAISDEWLAWNPASNPYAVTVKQAGFYNVYAYLNVGTAPSAGWSFRAKTGNFSTTEQVPGGMSDFSEYLICTTIAIDANESCRIEIRKNTNPSVDVTAAGLLFAPLSVA